MVASGKASGRAQWFLWVAFVSCLSLLVSPVASTFAEEASPPAEGEVMIVTDPAADPGDTGDSSPGEDIEGTGDTPADSGDVPADPGDVPANTGDVPADMGDAPADTGDVPADTGDAPADADNVAADTDDVSADSGNVPDDTGNAPAETGDVTGDTEGGETGEAPTAPEGPVQEPQTFDALIASEPETELTLMSVEDAGLDQQAVTSLESSGETGDMSIMASALAPVIDTPENVVAVLVGAGVTYSNVGYTGAQVSLGTFTGGTGIVGFEDGVILGSGDITDVVGPNNSGGTGTNNGEPGDDDLSTLAGDDTYDAAVLTFDFVPAGNQIVFNYVFSSEEYNEYVNEGFNDVFAFYVNGENCALVNGGAVSIDTINNGSNADLYVDNTDAHLNTGMDGLTVVLTCTANVNPGATNTMKLAIADSGDSILDSNVFIQAKSFVVPTPTPSTTPETPAPSPTATEVPGTPVPTETAGKPHKHYKSYKAYVEDCEDPVPAVALTYTSTSTGGTVKALPSTGAGSEQDGSTNLLVIAATIGAGVSLTGAIATSRNGREA